MDHPRLSQDSAALAAHPAEPHSPQWYDELATRQSAYAYPWHSTFSAPPGEAVYWETLVNELRPTDRVLDIGCGSGELTKRIGSLCRRVVGYDRVATFIETARVGAPDNVEFVVFDSKVQGFSGFPYALEGFDWVISSKGPLHWIGELPPLCSRGCRFLMLVPYHRPSPWHESLPESLRPEGQDAGALQSKVEALASKSGLTIHGWTNAEVEERLPGFEEFWAFLTWGRFDLDAYDGMKAACEGVFHRFQNQGAMVSNHGRLLWNGTVTAPPGSRL